MGAKKPRKKTSGKKSAAQRKKQKSSAARILVPLLILVITGTGIFVLVTRPESAAIQMKKGLQAAHVFFHRLTDPLRSREWKATLYFGDDSFNHLIKEYRVLKSVKSPQKMSEVLITELIRGPQAKGVRTLPEQTRLLSVQINREGLATVNFSREFTQLHPGGSSTEIMTVYAIVNTLTTNIKNVRMVRIYQENRPLRTIAGHIDCNRVFYPDPTIVQ